MENRHLGWFERCLSTHQNMSLNICSIFCLISDLQPSQKTADGEIFHAEMSISQLGSFGATSWAEAKAWALWSAHEALGAFGRHCMATGNWHLEAEGWRNTYVWKTKVLNKVLVRVTHTHTHTWKGEWVYDVYGFSWLFDSGSYQGSLQDSGDLL